MPVLSDDFLFRQEQEALANASQPVLTSNTIVKSAALPPPPTTVEPSPTGGTTSVVDTTTAQLTPEQEIALTNRQLDQITTPELPAGTEITPTLLEEQSGEQLPDIGLTETEGAAAGQAVAPVIAPAQVTDVAVADPSQIQVDTPTVIAELLGEEVPQAIAAQGEVSEGAIVQAQTLDTFSEGVFEAFANAAEPGTVDPNSLASVQLESLLNFNPNDIPAWALGAVRLANQQAAARGIGASTINSEAITTAVVQSALPIAFQQAKVFEQMNLTNVTLRQAVFMQKAGLLAQLDITNLTNQQQAAVENANRFFQMDLANLNNEQQAQTLNTQIRFQGMLSDQAATNAASQINAQNEQQTQLFMANLMSQLQQFNATQLNSMRSFNVQQQNQIAAINSQSATQIANANAERLTLTSQFNAQLSDSRDKFNANMSLAIEQSNIAWRRQINTANTAAINAANQLNVQNTFNLSQTALAQIWQQFRDEAFWANQVSENQLTRDHNIVMAALNRETSLQFLDEQNQQSLFQSLGAFAANVVGRLLAG